MSHNETTLFDLFLELFVSVDCSSQLAAMVQCFLEDIILNIVEKCLNVFFNAFDSHCRFFEGVTTHNFDSAVFEVASTQNEAYGHTLQFVIGKLEARTLVVGIVIFHTDTHRTKFFYDRTNAIVDGVELFLTLINRNNNHLNRGQLRRQHETIVIGVSHNQSTHQACRYAPRCSPNIFEFVIFIDKLHVECLGEVLTEEVRCARLESLTILHHCFDGVSFQCAGKAFVSRLHTFNYRNSHILFSKIGIYIKHFHSFSFSFFASGMCCVTFLP